MNPSLLFPLLLALSLLPATGQAAPSPAEAAFQSVVSVLAPDLKTAGIRPLFTPADDADEGVAGVNNSYGDVPVKVGKKWLASSLSEENWQVIFCHEMGHLLGGAPYTWVNQDDGGDFSAEGQADCFAASKCLRRLWSDPVENAREAASLEPKLVAQAKARGCQTDQCVRIAAAGLELLTRFYPEKVPALDQHSAFVAKETKSQPVALPAQCRLDTMVAGALCPISPSVPFSANNQRDGACTADSPDPLVRAGARPVCWFMPDNLDSKF
jgi:hypothetical protein